MFIYIRCVFVVVFFLGGGGHFFFQAKESSLSSFGAVPEGSEVYGGCHQHILVVPLPKIEYWSLSKKVFLRFFSAGCL